MSKLDKGSKMFKMNQEVKKEKIEKMTKMTQLNKGTNKEKKN